MALDSASYFTERLEFLGLAPYKKKFEDLGWSTMGMFAFTTSYVPHSGNDEPFCLDILEPCLGNRTHPDKSSLRRLFYEAYGLAALDLGQRTTGRPDDLPRVIPNAEREARRLRVEKHLSPLTNADGKLVGELDVSNRLIDQCIWMYDKNHLSYLGLEMCTKRSTELDNEKLEKYLVPKTDKDGILRMAPDLSDQLRADLSSQLAIMYAFQRRSIAMEAGELASFESGEALRNIYIQALFTETEPGYAPVNMEQIMQADRKAWKLLAQYTRAGVQSVGGIGRPCDLAMKEVLKSFEFFMAIAPRQTVVRQSAPPLPDSHRGPPIQKDGISKKEVKRVKQEAAAKRIADAFAAAPVVPPKREAPRPPRDGKKPKGRMPKGLEGMCSSTSAATGSKRVCYNYHLGTCSDAQPGQQCKRGWHLCLKPTPSGEACSKAHSTGECPL